MQRWNTKKNDLQIRSTSTYASSERQILVGHQQGSPTLLQIFEGTQRGKMRSWVNELAECGGATIAELPLLTETIHSKFWRAPQAQNLVETWGRKKLLGKGYLESDSRVEEEKGSKSSCKKLVVIIKASCNIMWEKDYRITGEEQWPHLVYKFFSKEQYLTLGKIISF